MHTTRDSTHSSFKRFVPRPKEIWSFIVSIISIISGKRFGKVLCYTASSENRIGPSRISRPPPVEMTDTDNSSDEIFNHLLVRSIRENHANTEKISDFEWEDIEHQDSGDVF
ncbi:MAG: hypothetical protein WA364_11660 [Candidatus Nitrosopolaris sp.]